MRLIVVPYINNADYCQEQTQCFYFCHSENHEVLCKVLSEDSETDNVTQEDCHSRMFQKSIGMLIQKKMTLFLPD